MNVVMICGTWSTGLHGRIDAEKLFEARALTGSESSFFNVARGLSELGHKVTVFCDVMKPLDSCDRLAGAAVRHIDEPFPTDADAYISLNEPDQFRRLPVDVKGIRIVQQQVNDFPYCQPGFENFVDIYAFLSPVHRDHVLKVTPQIDVNRAWWIPNSINLELFDQWKDEKRVPHTAAWCSSPDRGLHRLLEIWPLVLKQVPDAKLDIFYRFDPWYDEFKNHNNKTGARARYIGEALRVLGRNGEKGVRLVGPIPNKELAKVLRRTDVLPYTCDCITFTEGFSVAIMDACAAGAVPVISDTDAIGDIYWNVAYQVKGKVGEQKDEWVKAIVRAFTDEPFKEAMRVRTRKFAERFTRQNIAKLWEILISSNLGKKSDYDFGQHLPWTIQNFGVPVEPPDVAKLFRDNDPGTVTPVIVTTPEAPVVKEKKVSTPLSRDFEYMVVNDDATKQSIEGLKDKGFEYVGRLYRRDRTNAVQERLAEKTESVKVSSEGPEITVLLGSNRPGGIDINLAGLAKQTFKDFEIIFVDGLYHRRHEGVLKLVEFYGIKQPFYHVPNHRYGTEPWGSTCAGYNTGFALAAGKFVVMLLDFGYAPPNWLAQHIEHLRSGNKFIMAPHEYRTLDTVNVKGNAPLYDFIEHHERDKTLPYLERIAAMQAQRARFDDLTVFAHPFRPEDLDKFKREEWQEMKLDIETGPCEDTNLFNTKNESFPLTRILEVNGMDENYDRGIGPGDPDLGLRLRRIGLEPWVVKEALVHCMNPRRILPNVNLVLLPDDDVKLPSPDDHRWSRARGLGYFDEVKDGGHVRARNPFSIVDLRVQIWPWREISQRKSADLPKIVIPDQDYFR